jgi:uncharacterized coiled-coil DUF342 family protein
MSTEDRKARRAARLEEIRERMVSPVVTGTEGSGRVSDLARNLALSVEIASIAQEIIEVDDEISDITRKLEASIERVSKAIERLRGMASDLPGLRIPCLTGTEIVSEILTLAEEIDRIEEERNDLKSEIEG